MKKLFSIFLLILLMQSSVFASTTPDPGVKEIMSLVSMGIKVVNAVLMPALIMIGDLLNSDLLLGGRMEDTMLNVWSLIRNLVNIVFAIFLMGVAIYNVFGLGEDEGNFAIKTALPRLIIGLVIVNFTFPIGKIAIDMATVATQVSFNLVGTEITDTSSLNTTQEKFKNNICMSVSTETKKAEAAPASSSTPEPAAATTTAASAAEPKKVPISKEQYDKDSLAQTFCAVNEEKKPTGELKSWVVTDHLEEINSNNIGLVMAVNMQNITTLNLLDDKKVDTWEDLTTSMIFSFLIYVVLVFSYLALAWVLLTRIFVLWGALILSPVAVLFYVIPEIKEWLGLGDEMTSKVIKHLIAPVVIGITLSLGFILLNTWQDVGSADAALGNISVESILSTGLTSYTDFLVLIGSVVVLWMGVFSASSGTFAESFTSSLKDFGETTGAWIAKQPLNAPLIPFGTAGGGDEAKKLSLLGIPAGIKRDIANSNYASSKSEFSILDALNRGAGRAEATPLKDTAVKVKAFSDETTGPTVNRSDYHQLIQDLIRQVEGSIKLNKTEKERAVVELKGYENDANLRNLHSFVDTNPEFRKVLEEDAEAARVLQEGVRSLSNKTIAPEAPRP